jgi:tetratricopeptide (TPR) repeat protein
VLLTRLGAEELKGQDSVAGMIEQLKRTPGDVDLMYRIAKKHQADKDDYEAMLAYEEILRRDPEDRHGYKTEALFWKASYDGVIRKQPGNLTAFISEHPDYKDIKNAYTFLAKAYLRRGEMNKAVQVYHDALTVFAKDADFYNGYAWWVYENKVKTEYATAIRHTKRALEWKPQSCYILDTLAWLYFENGEQELAVEASTKALSLAPGNSRKYYEESLARIKRGRK